MWVVLKESYVNIALSSVRRDAVLKHSTLQLLKILSTTFNFRTGKKLIRTVWISIVRLNKVARKCLQKIMTSRTCSCPLNESNLTSTIVGIKKFGDWNRDYNI